jgi:hypothetical protein
MRTVIDAGTVEFVSDNQTLHGFADVRRQFSINLKPVTSCGPRTGVGKALHPFFVSWVPADGEVAPHIGAKVTIIIETM